jgi:hypothetical protein
MSAVSCRPVKRRSLPSPYEAMCSLCLNPSLLIASLMIAKPPSSRMDFVLSNKHTTRSVEKFGLQTHLHSDIDEIFSLGHNNAYHINEQTYDVSEQILTNHPQHSNNNITCSLCDSQHHSNHPVFSHHQTSKQHQKKYNFLLMLTKKNFNAQWLQKMISYFNRLRVQ